MTNKQEEFFEQIKKDCFKIIKEKQVDIEDLSCALGIKEEKFYQNFSRCIPDLTFYLKTYDLLLNWSE